MCTVTFVPQPEGFILTSNRDEHISRSETKFPVSLRLGGEAVVFPQDPAANGTWIAMSSTRLVCLLNGGFLPHKRELPYRKSRGLMVLDRFKWDRFSSFVSEYNFDNIEPFMLVSVENGVLTPELKVLVWDGKNTHLDTLASNQSHIWSSSSLYDNTTKQVRQDYFKAQAPESAAALLNFHLSRPEGWLPSHQFMMKRANGLETISTTQIRAKHDFREMQYHNHIAQNHQILTI